MNSLLRSIINRRIPGQLIIQVTARCNARCPQCGMRATESFARSTLTTDRIKKTIDAAARRGMQAISFTGDKVRVYPRGIDTRRFHPGKRNGFYERWNCPAQTIHLIYVGRVSKEKNLHLLADAYRRLVRLHHRGMLTVVGDGPYLDEMKAALEDLPCIFTGRLEGEELAAAYASSDAFVFPSATDTFGNVVLEAQASGLPVIVSDRGGPVENIIPEETGIVVKADCVQSLCDAMAALTADPGRRAAMGRAARRYMRKRSFEAAFDEAWGMFGSVNAERQATV